MIKADKSEQQSLKFLAVLDDYAVIWNGHLEKIMTGKHFIKLYDSSVRSTQGAPYRAGTTARRFEATKIGRTLQRKVNDVATREWKSPFVFAPKKDGLL